MSVVRALTRPAALIALLALSPTAATGCGSDDASGSEQDRVERVVDAWQSSIARGDGEATCSGLTAAGRKELLLVRGGVGGIPIDASCPQTVRWIRKGSRVAGLNPRPPKVVSVQVDGDRAVAQVSAGEFRPQPLRLVKQDDEWKISSPGFRSPLPGDYRGRRSGR